MRGIGDSRDFFARAPSDATYTGLPIIHMKGGRQTVSNSGTVSYPHAGALILWESSGIGLFNDESATED